MPQHNVTDSLKNTFRKLSKEGIEDIIQKWRFLSEEPNFDFDEVDMRTMGKQTLVNYLVGFCQEVNVSMDDAAELDLLYTEENSQKRMWSMHSLETKKTSHQCQHSARELQKHLSKEVELCFSNYVCVRKYNAALWIKIGVDSAKARVAETLFAVYYLHHPQHLLVSTNMGLKNRNLLLDALCDSLGFLSIKETALKGRNVKALFQIAITRGKSLAGDKYSERNNNQCEEDSIFKSVKRIRKSVDIENIAPLDKDSQDNIEKALDKSLGTFQQPPVENVQIKFCTQFHGSKSVPDLATDENPFYCQVKFSGTNVYEGLRNMVEAGCANVKVVPLIKNIRSLGKTHLTMDTA